MNTITLSEQCQQTGLKTHKTLKDTTYTHNKTSQETNLEGGKEANSKINCLRNFKGTSWETQNMNRPHKTCSGI